MSSVYLPFFHISLIPFMVTSSAFNASAFFHVTLSSIALLKTKAEPRRRKSVQRKTTFLAKRRPAVKKSQSFVSKTSGRGKEKSRGRKHSTAASKLVRFFFDRIDTLDYYTFL